MKTLIKSIGFACISLVFSCINEELPIKEGSVKFNFKEAGSGKITSDPEISAVVLSITKSDGTVVEEMLKLDLFSFGTDYVSNSVQLPVGHYKLTEFLILNSDDDVIFACPIEGSELSSFVEDPLPINFEVTEDGITYVKPQVLAVTEESDPEDFGYVKFGFEIVAPVPNSLKLTLDDKLWVPTYIEQVIFNTENNFFVITARKHVPDNKYESLWILIPNFELKVGNWSPEEVEIQMGFNESEHTGTYYDSDWGQVPEVVTFTVTDYDPVNKLISGKFSGHLIGGAVIGGVAGGDVKIVKDGVFYKLKVSFQ